MAAKVSVFKTLEDKTRYDKAYAAVLNKCSVPCDELSIHTRFGDTHVITSGASDSAPLILLHFFGGGATCWFQNIGPLSQNFRTYAVDVIGEPNPSSPIRPIKSRLEFAEWMADLFDGLKIKSSHIVGNSFGGFLAINTALSQPERVNKIVLISPAATFVQIWGFYLHNMLPNMIHSKPLMRKGLEWLRNGLSMDEDFAAQVDIATTAGVFYNRVFPVVFFAIVTTATNHVGESGNGLEVTLPAII